MGLFAAYDLSINIDNVLEIEIGRFSHGTLGRIRIYSRPSDAIKGPLLSVGCFCEFSETSLVILGGEHRNDHLYNVTLGRGGTFYKAFMPAGDLSLCEAQPSSGIIIGDDVVLSTNSIVLDGATIQKGCLLGAGSILSGDTSPFGIYVGTPAKFLKDRLSAHDQEKHAQIDMPNIAAHAIPCLPSTALAFQNGAISKQVMRERLPLISARPKLHAIAKLTPEKSIGQLQIRSFSVGAEVIEDAAKIERLHRYFAQFSSPDETVQWVPDVFLALGLITAEQ
jgi:acetyltransferase-like isoleucine patch superfamily enzyme